jgi:ATP-dependent helicase HrpB
VIPLPIDSFLPAIVDAVRSRGMAVVTAAPGAGKTTRVPPVLADDGPVLVLQPRRVAARSMAARIAEERGWTLGREVGWQVRFEQRYTRDTRVLFATEGILTARISQDPLLSEFRTVVIDEFHERSIHADVGLALAKQAWLARRGGKGDDLRLIVMSATIDAARVAAYLGGDAHTNPAPVIDVPGRMFPLEIAYRPGVSVDSAVVECLEAGTTGAILCFLPGAGEIARAAAALAPRLGAMTPPVRVLPLHGGLDADTQDDAIRPSSDRRVILATNLAETTITVPDVTAVVDSGVHKVARYDADRAIDRLVTERIPQDSADQRAGRAGRVRAGLVRRLWDERDRLRPHREAEIHRVDLAATLLDVIAWGGDVFTPGGFDWFEAPPAGAIEAARELLMRLGGLDDQGRITALGEELRRLPIHPRLGRLLLADGKSERAALAAAFISEGTRRSKGPGIQGSKGTTECDLLAMVEDGDVPPHVRKVARALAGKSGSAPAGDFRRAVFAAYPDRLARRRSAHSDQFVMASGTGARLGRASAVHTAEFVVAVELRSQGPRVQGSKGPATEAVIEVASSVQPEWIVPTAREVRHEFDDATGAVRAARVDVYDALVLASHPVAPDPEAAGPLVARAWHARARSARDQQLLARLRFAGTNFVPSDVVFLETLISTAASGVTRLADLDLESALAPDVRRRLDRDAPPMLRVPSGRDRALEYREDGAVVCAVKLQELFGLADSPRLGPAKTPVTFELLAPNGRPVQVTRDLRSFWSRGYQDVRKELRARYPKHPWPEDPWTAPPTARTTRRAK